MIVWVFLSNGCTDLLSLLFSHFNSNHSEVCQQYCHQYCCECYPYCHYWNAIIISGNNFFSKQTHSFYLRICRWGCNCFIRFLRCSWIGWFSSIYFNISFWFFYCCFLNGFIWDGIWIEWEIWTAIAIVLNTTKNVF